jgi:hypothetical protein
MVVENRTGAGAVTGTNLVAQAPADGYTLIMVFDSFTMNPYLYKNVQYDPVRDFIPITLVVRNPQLIAAHPSLGVKNINEFIKLAKARGSKLDFATAGAGTSSGLTLELLKMTAGLDSTAVHYKGGAPVVNDLLGGQVPVTVITMGSSSGVRPTATASENSRASSQSPLVKPLTSSTTGTITGVARYLKEKNPAIRIIGAQPSEGSRIPGIRKWAPAYLPKIYDPANVDELRYVSQVDAEDMCRRMAREEGIFAGISAAGACWVALQIAQQVRDATIVFIVCDRGDRYLSTGVFPA